MDFHELQKTRVADLRDMMKEHLPEVQGVIGLKKEELVDALAESWASRNPTNTWPPDWAKGPSRPRSATSRSSARRPSKPRIPPS